MHKIFLHLGLHKTATTSLQSGVFGRSGRQKFIGRDVNKNLTNQQVIYHHITRFCFSRKSGDIRTVRARLDAALASTSIILSEEWFTSDYSAQSGLYGVCWQQKLERLGQIVQGYPVKLLLTLRAPDKALCSLYREFYPIGIASEYPTVLKFASESNHAKAYDYPYLNELVCRVFGTAPQYLCFEDLIERPDEYCASLRCWLETTDTVRIPHRNRGAVSKMAHQPSLLRDWIDGIAARIPQVVKDRVGPRLRNTINALVRRGSEVRVDDLSEAALQEVLEKYADAYEFLGARRLKPQ